MIIGYYGETSLSYYQTLVLTGMARAAKETGHTLYAFSAERLFAMSNYIRQFQTIGHLVELFKLDVLIYIGWFSEEHVRLVSAGLKPSIPRISIGQIIPGVPSIYQDGARLMGQLMDHLILEHGYRKIALVDSYNGDDRAVAYRQALEKHGLGYDPDLHLLPTDLAPDGVSEDSVFRASIALAQLFDLRQCKPEVIISLYSREVAEMVDLLQARGLQVPNDIALVGWEDGDWSKYKNPPITSVSFPWEEMGYQAVIKANAVLRGLPYDMATSLPSQIRIRHSCGCNRHFDELQIQPSNHDRWPNTPSLIFKELQDRLLKIRNYSQGAISQLQQGFLLAMGQTLQTIVLDPVILKARDNLIVEGIKLLQDYQIISFGQDRTEAAIMHQNLGNIGRKIVTSLSLQSLKLNIELALTNLNIPFCQIYTAKDPKNFNKAELLYSYRDGRRRSIQTLKPLEIYSQRSGKVDRIFMIKLLQVGDLLAGYVVFEAGPEDERIYYSLAVYLATTIHSIQNMEKLRSSREKIQSSQITLNRRTAELESLNFKLSELDRVKNEFIANITHDFRSPLSVAMGFSELGMEAEADHGSETYEKFELIHQASLKLKSSIDRFLDLAKMDYTGLKVKVHPVDLAEFLRDICNFYRSSLSSTAITVAIKLPDFSIDDFWTDLEKLEIVLNNLISNAIKFVDERSGQIEITLSEQGDYVCIGVSDNGIGIPADKIETIFDRFVQLESGRNSRYKGTGIGLAFCRQMVHFLKGTLVANSSGLGHGAEFSIRLPRNSQVFSNLERQEQAQPSKHSQTRQDFLALLQADLKDRFTESLEVDEAEPRQSTDFNIYHARLMIIDDEPAIREISKSILQSAGYKNFVLASDGLSAKNSMQVVKPDICICDINMPSMRGDELFDWVLLQDDLNSIPFIFISAVHDEELIFSLRRKMACAVLIKPIDPKELVLNVQFHLTRYFEHLKLLQS